MNNPENSEVRNSGMDQGENWIRVGMSTCGVAAGADKVYEHLKKEIKRNNLDLELKRCGCLGACYAEPLVEIKYKGLPRVIYGKVDEGISEKIIEEHIIKGRVLDSGIYEFNTNRF